MAGKSDDKLESKGGSFFVAYFNYPKWGRWKINEMKGMGKNS